jgi:hypothetical protein
MSFSKASMAFAKIGSGRGVRLSDMMQRASQSGRPVGEEAAVAIAVAMAAVSVSMGAAALAIAVWAFLFLH